MRYIKTNILSSQHMACKKESHKITTEVQLKLANAHT